MDHDPLGRPSGEKGDDVGGEEISYFYLPSSVKNFFEIIYLFLGFAFGIWVILVFF